MQNQDYDDVESPTIPDYSDSNPSKLPDYRAGPSVSNTQDVEDGTTSRILSMAVSEVFKDDDEIEEQSDDDEEALNASEGQSGSDNSLDLGNFPKPPTNGTLPDRENKRLSGHRSKTQSSDDDDDDEQDENEEGDKASSVASWTEDQQRENAARLAKRGGGWISSSPETGSPTGGISPIPGLTSLILSGDDDEEGDDGEDDYDGEKDPLTRSLDKLEGRERGKRRIVVAGGDDVPTAEEEEEDSGSEEVEDEGDDEQRTSLHL